MYFQELTLNIKIETEEKTVFYKEYENEIAQEKKALQTISKLGDQICQIRNTTINSFNSILRTIYSIDN